MLEKLVFKRCCCCSLKAGCLTLGIIYLILDLLNIAFSAFLISHLSINYDGPWEWESTLEDGKVGREVYIGQCVLSLILSTISLTTSTLLIVGVCTANYNFIYPTLVWIPALFIIRIVSLCWLCVHSYWQQVKVQRGAPQRIEMTEEAN